MKVTHDGRRITVEVTSDGAGLVSHVGSVLLSQVADKSGLTRGLSRGLGPLQLRAGSHDRGRVVRDLAVMLADGGECVSDLGAIRDQQALFGPVASDSTAFRVIDRVAADPAPELPHLTEQMLVTLGKANIRTLDDLADLATDELIQKKRVEPRRREPSNRPEDKGGILAEYGLSEEQGNEIIMAARAHWFEDEPATPTTEEDAVAGEEQ